MNNQERIVSRKYACAFLNIFHQSLSRQDVPKIKKLLDSLSEKKGINLFFKLGLISSQVKIDAIKQELKKYKLGYPWGNLVTALVKHKRVFLFPMVLFYIERFYLDFVGLVEWRVSSSYLLDSEQKKTLEKFLAEKTKKEVECEYIVDSDLVAGIRMQSNNLLWEHSVRKKLRNLKTIIFNQEVL